MSAAERGRIRALGAGSAARRSGRGGADPSDVDLLQLVASVEPSVVFASLASQCVPAVCDDCRIDIIDGTHARYSIVYPPRASVRGLRRLDERDAATAEQSVQVRFDHTPDEGLSAQFYGTATFVWFERPVTRADRTLANVLVDHAVGTVLWQRSEQSASRAAAATEHLQAALRFSRHIGAAVGILMSLHWITEDDAFEILRLASQRTNRKLRDLAFEVIDSGWLDPATITPMARVGDIRDDDEPDSIPRASAVVHDLDERWGRERRRD